MHDPYQDHWDDTIETQLREVPLMLGGTLSSAQDHDRHPANRRIHYLAHHYPAHHGRRKSMDSAAWTISIIAILIAVAIVIDMSRKKRGRRDEQDDDQ